MQEGELDTKRVVKILDHPARKRIIDLLGTKGALPWKELASELGMGTGALYYHLDTLEGIVSRDSSKKYALTKSGHAVYEYLKTNPLPGPMEGVALALGSRGRNERYLETLFAPRPILERMTSTGTRSLAVLVLFSSALFAAMSYLGNEPRLFYLTPTASTLDRLGSYVLSLVSLVLISYLGTLTLFRERATLLSLGASSAVSFLPIVSFSVLLRLLQYSSAAPLDTRFLTVALVFFQAWSATILAAGISVSSSVRVEKSIIVSLIVLYATMILVFL